MTRVSPPAGRFETNRGEVRSLAQTMRVDRIQTLSPARAIQLILFFPPVKLRNVRAETLLTACSQATNGRQLKLRVTQLKLPCNQGIDAWRVLLGIIH